MKKLILITIILSNQIFAAETFLGVKYNSSSQKMRFIALTQHQENQLF